MDKRKKNKSKSKMQTNNFEVYIGSTDWWITVGENFKVFLVVYLAII